MNKRLKYILLAMTLCGIFIPQSAMAWWGYGYHGGYRHHVGWGPHHHGYYNNCSYKRVYYHSRTGVHHKMMRVCYANPHHYYH